MGTNDVAFLGSNGQISIGGPSSGSLKQKNHSPRMTKGLFDGLKRGIWKVYESINFSKEGFSIVRCHLNSSLFSKCLSASLKCVKCM